MRTHSYIIFLGVFLPVAATAGTDPQKSIDLIRQASEKSDIFELSSFVIKADVRLDNFGKPLNGTYTLFWNNPGQWREEIILPGYSEIRVGGKNVVYLKRTTPYFPYQVFRLRTTLGFGPTEEGTGFSNVEPRKGEAIKKIREQKLPRGKATCAELASEAKSIREVCVDQVTGTIRRDRKNLLDSDWAVVGSKQFPRSMSLVENSRRIVDVHISEFKMGEPQSDANFEPPPGAVSRVGCMNPIVGGIPIESNRSIRQSKK
jgi:hypothetical protein